MNRLLRMLRLFLLGVLVPALAAIPAFAQDRPAAGADLFDGLLEELAAESEAEANQPPQARVDSVSRRVEAIRGREFKHSISAKKQSMADFEKYMDREFSRQMPDARMKAYGKIVKAVGLYRGPEIEDFVALAKRVMKSQAAAYYDPETKTFYILEGLGSAAAMADILYAHELTHGLQDQHFDLEKYLLGQAGKGMNDDALLARQCVVEGEATYVMNLLTMEGLGELGGGPRMMDAMVRMQSEMNVEMMRQALEGDAAMLLGEDEAQAALDSTKDIPRFVLETMMGAYLKGMAFIHAVRKEGWDKVDELFVSNPPTTSEQILHPEKWLAGEGATEFQWPDFKGAPALASHALLDSNTIGEIQWRIVFEEHGLGRRSKKAADGWDGDLYAVLQGPDAAAPPGALFVSSWDSEAEAEEFAGAYSEVQMVKNKDLPADRRVVAEGTRVYILEGFKPEDAPAILEFMKGAGAARKGGPAVSAEERKSI